MRTVQRIQQLAQPIIEESLRLARTEVEARQGHAFSDEQWATFMSKGHPAVSKQHMVLAAKFEALLQHLDEVLPIKGQ